MKILKRWGWWWCSIVVVVTAMVKADTHEEERLVMGVRRVKMKKEIKELKEEVLPVLSLGSEEISIVKGDTGTLQISLSHDPAACINVTLVMSQPIAKVHPSSFKFCHAATHPITISSTQPGTTALVAYVDQPEWIAESSRNTFCKVSVILSHGLTIAADVLGWVYTIAWDASFLPQILHNFQRRSVVGLSFDFLTFNFIGFFSYFLFNMSLFWIPDIQAEYALRFPQTILHVRLNDVIFPLYALLCTAVQGVQCSVYQRAPGQRISMACRVVSGLLLLAVAVGSLLVPLIKTWWWLDVLYLLSYVKLTITAIKYIPQLWVNYKSNSTEGWSIYQVMLDFTGGSLSLVQMFLLSANYDDWESLLTDPAKLGLGSLSIVFNILFFIQHYCLYRHPPASPGKESKDTSYTKDPDNVLQLTTL